jgi:hypothetical protein
MQTELGRLEKLIERKKSYLKYLQESDGKQKNIDAVKAEINIIEGFVDAVHDHVWEQKIGYDNYEIAAEKKIKQLESIKFKLEGVCLLYGISQLQILYYTDSYNGLIISDLKLDQQDGVIRVPERIKQFLKTDIQYHGEKELEQLEEYERIRTSGQHRTGEAQT